MASFICGTCGGQVPLGKQRDRGSVPCPGCSRTSEWDGGILKLSSEANDGDYPPEVYDLLAETEPQHFWFRARNRVILSALREVLGPLQGRSYLDVGCGTGYVLQSLESAGMTCCGLDMHITGLRYARVRTNALLVCESAARIPFERQFGVVGLCDVIEHVDDDVLLLKSAAQATQDDGYVLVTVPAQPSLWTHVDEAWGHKRRYSKTSLARALDDAGLEVRLMRYFNVLLHPIQAVQRRLIRNPATMSSDHTLVLTREALRVPPAPVNSALDWLAGADMVLGRLSLPIGTSLIAIATAKC